MATDHQRYPYIKPMIGWDLFYDLSKGALATVVASLLSTGGDHPEQVRGRLLVELENLHTAGLMPWHQARAYRDEAAAARATEEVLTMTRLIADRISDNAMSDDQLIRVWSILVSNSSTLHRQADRYTGADETEAATQARRDAAAVEALLAIVVNERRQRRLDAQVLDNMRKEN